MRAFLLTLGLALLTAPALADPPAAPATSTPWAPSPTSDPTSSPTPANPWAPAPTVPAAPYAITPPADAVAPPTKPAPAKPAAPAPKPSPRAGASAADPDAFVDENLILAMPSDWIPAFVNDDPNLKRKHIEFTPKGESARSWTSKITLQSIQDAPIGAEAFVAAYKSRFEQSQSCEDASFTVLAIGKQSGFDAVLADMSCPRNHRLNRGEYAMMQVIRGKDALYVVIRARRADPFAKGHLPMTQEEHGEWLRFMKMAAVCDSRDPAKPCPGQTPAPAPGPRKKPEKPEKSEKAEKPEKKPTAAPADPVAPTPAPAPAAPKSE